MKSIAYVGLPALFLICLLAIAPSAHAQTLLANVPFDYIVGNNRFPAGQYTVKMGDSTILIRGPENQTLWMITQSTQRMHPSDKSSLVFHCYSDKCFLAQVWTAGESLGLELPPSKAERQVGIQARDRRADDKVVAALTVK